MRHDRFDIRRIDHVQVVLVFACTLFVAGDAAAQLDQFRNLGNSIVSVLQGIGVIISAIGFITAGVKANSGHPGAKEQAANALVGSALIAGAVILAAFVKSFF